MGIECKAFSRTEGWNGVSGERFFLEDSEFPPLMSPDVLVMCWRMRSEWMSTSFSFLTKIDGLLLCSRQSQLHLYLQEVIVLFFTHSSLPHRLCPVFYARLIRCRDSDGSCTTLVSTIQHISIYMFATTSFAGAHPGSEAGVLAGGVLRSQTMLRDK